MKAIVKKILLRLGLFALSVWFIYVGAVAIVLNTHLFLKLTGMDDVESTHVEFNGALSPFPGFLWIGHAKLFISDQNVSISIYLNRTFARFDLGPIREKRIRFTELNVGDAWVDLGMKTPAQTLAHISKHTELKDVNIDLKREKGKEALRDHIKLEFPNISIEHITRIETSIGKFVGDFNLKGGFRIQPGAEVEVFPTDLFINHVNLPGEFSDINGKAHVQFDRFFIPDAPGNAVFPFINGTLDAQAKVQSLDFLNVTLRKLPNYQMSQGETQVKLNLGIDHGRLLENSGLATEPSFVTLQTPDVRATGHGQITWHVHKGDTSTLSANLHGIRVKQIKDNSQNGTLSDLGLKLVLYGNELLDPFHGVASELDLKNVQWVLQSPQRVGKKKNISFKGTVSGSGKILGISGVLPKNAETHWKNQSTRFNLKLSSFEMQSNFLPPVQLSGTFAVLAKPIDFGTSSLVIPEIETKLAIAVQGDGSTEAEGKLTNVNYLLAPYHQWKGHLGLNLSSTKPFVKALQDEKKLSWLLAAFARVQNLSHDIDWEMGDEYTWFRVNEVKSSAGWTAHGSLLNGPDGLLGAFEVRLGFAKVPVGVRIFPDKTDVTLMPSKEWYNELLVEPPSGALQAAH